MSFELVGKVGDEGEWTPDERETASFVFPGRPTAIELPVPIPSPPEPRPLPFHPDAGPLRRFSPRKLWPEVLNLDERLAQLDRQRMELGETIGQLERAISDASLADKVAIANWQLEGAAGKRPSATAPALEAELEQVRSDLDSYAIAEDRVLREKVAFVEENRKRLVKDAAKPRHEKVEQLCVAIEVVEQARAEVVDALGCERWALKFPGEDANAASLDLLMMRGGRTSKAMPSVRTREVADSVLAWLRDDAAWLDRAVAEDSKERPDDPHHVAIWEGTDEGRQAIFLANERVAQGLKPRAVREAEWL